MDLLNKYFQTKKEVFCYFNYNGVDLPLQDQTDSYWMVADRGSGYIYASEPFSEKAIEGGLFYSGYVSNIYYGKDHNMIVADTQCNGKRFLMIVSDDKECTDPILVKLYEKHWG